jgi:hypothetical protein
MTTMWASLSSCPVGWRCDSRKIANRTPPPPLLLPQMVGAVVEAGPEASPARSESDLYHLDLSKSFLTVCRAAILRLRRTTTGAAVFCRLLHPGNWSYPRRGQQVGLLVLLARSTRRATVMRDLCQAPRRDLQQLQLCPCPQLRQPAMAWSRQEGRDLPSRLLRRPPRWPAVCPRRLYLHPPINAARVDPLPAVRKVLAARHRGAVGELRVLHVDHAAEPEGLEVPAEVLAWEEGPCTRDCQRLLS